MDVRSPDNTSPDSIDVAMRDQVIKSVDQSGYTIAGDYIGEGGKTTNFRNPREDLKLVSLGRTDPLPGDDHGLERVLVYDPNKVEAKILEGDEYGKLVDTSNRSVKYDGVDDLSRDGWRNVSRPGITGSLNYYAFIKEKPQS